MRAWDSETDGIFYQRIFSTLQRYERLSLPRLKIYSRLTDRQLHHGLTAMIQHHLVYHFTSLEDGITYYEANTQAAYYLVRSGKILKLVEDRLGEYAARVMEALLFLGHASVRQLENLPELQSRKTLVPSGNQHVHGELQDDDLEAEGAVGRTNGDHASEAKPVPFHSTLKALASHGYILRVRESHFQSPSDNLLEAQRVVSARSDIKVLKGKKQEETTLLKTQELVEERMNGDLTKGLVFNGLPRGVKRKFANGSLNEQQRTARNGMNGDHAEEEEEANEWSEDEDGFDNIPMEVSLCCSIVFSRSSAEMRGRLD